jgi:hypothetical protein
MMPWLQNLSRGILPVLAVLACVAPAPGEAAPEFERPFPMKLEALPAVGEKLVPKPETSFMVMTSPSQLYESQLVEVGGVVYELGIDKQERVQFISTSDPRFRTPEGLKIWDSLAAVRVFAAEKMQVEGGWARYLSLSSGWNAVIVIHAEGDALSGVVPDTGEAEPGDGYVSFFFRRQ